jgi:hypothetical protein
MQVLRFVIICRSPAEESIENRIGVLEAAEPYANAERCLLSLSRDVEGDKATRVERDIGDACILLALMGDENELSFTGDERAIFCLSES